MLEIYEKRKVFNYIYVRLILFALPRFDFTSRQLTVLPYYCFQLIIKLSVCYFQESPIRHIWDFLFL